MARCLESLNQLRAEEIDDYCVGFNAASAGEELDENKSKAWLRGWSGGRNRQKSPADYLRLFTKNALVTYPGTWDTRGASPICSYIPTKIQGDKRCVYPEQFYSRS